MTDKDPQHDPPPGGTLIEFESIDRWIAGKSQGELLHDLKIYLARLRDQPRSIPDRLRVAAIQLKLGRTQEALVHYEGVVRGYVADGRVMSAIALCKRIIGYYPRLPRISQLLAALYAHAPHGSTGVQTPVTPLDGGQARAAKTFVVTDPVDADPHIDESMVVDRVFGEQAATTPVTCIMPPSAEDLSRSRREGVALPAAMFHEDRPTVPYDQVQLSMPEDAPTTIYDDPSDDEDAETCIASPYQGSPAPSAPGRAPGASQTPAPVPLTRTKTAAGYAAPESQPRLSRVSSSVSVVHEPADGGDEPVVLLTRPKRK